MSRYLSVLLAAALAGCGSSGGGINAEGLSCEKTSDCGSGFVCGVEKRCEAAYDGVNGVSSTEMLIGNSAGTVTGNATSSCRGVVNGISAVFKHVNDTGGIHGRMLKLDQRDDGYDPDRALENVKAMTSQNGSSRSVFALLGNYGSATTKKVLDTALGSKTPLFGSITGTGALRKVPPDRYVFNFRAGSEEQAGLAVRYMTTDGDLSIHPSNIAVFAQGSDSSGQDKCTWDASGEATCETDDDSVAKMDAFGRAGFDGVWKQMKQEFGVSQKEIIFATYTRNMTDVEGAVGRYLNWLARPKKADEVDSDGKFDAGIVLQAVRVPSARLVEALVDELDHARAGRAVSPQYNMSAEATAELAKVKKVTFVGTALSKVFADELLQTGSPEKYCKNVLAMQIVPDPVSSGSLVLEYRERLQAYDRNLGADAYSLEGYIAAKIFVAGLERQGPDVTTEAFVSTLEDMSEIDIGLGVPLGFSSQDHQASHTVWARKLNSSCVFESFTELSF